MNTILRALILCASASFTAAADSGDVTAPVGDPLPGLTAAERAMFFDGKALYDHDFTPEEGVGPMFNEQACGTCHGGPVTGGFDPDGVANNVTHFTVDTGPVGQNFQVFELGGPVIQKRAISESFDTACQLPPKTIPTGIPGGAVSPRHTPAVFGFGLLDAISDEDILAYEGKQPWKRPGVYGVANWGVELEGLALMAAFHLDGTRKMPVGPARVARFGWKSSTATLWQFTTEPFNIELGVSTPFFPRENHPFGDQLPPECLTANQPNDVNSQNSLRLYYFQAFLAAPDRLPMNQEARRGERVFKEAGCLDCHRESFRTADYYAPGADGTPFKVEALSRKRIQPYSDLLLHDMGEALADQRPQGRASGRMWRTTPLWGLRHKTHLLHDGRVTTVDAAIDAHGGEGTWSRDAYRRLPERDRQALLEFLGTL